MIGGLQPGASLLILVPAILAISCVVAPARLAKWFAVASGLSAIGLVLALNPGASGFVGQERISWAPAIGTSYHVGVEGFGGALLVLSGLLFTIGALASGAAFSPRWYFALWCALQAMISGLFVARDLLLFFVFWEAMLIPLSLLMWGWGGADRRSATLRFLLYTMTGSALLLAGIISLGVGAGTFDIQTLAAARVGADQQTILAALFIAAFAVKLPLFPFHAWLPRAYLAAPIPVALVLSGVVAKTAVYGIVSICLVLFPAGMERLAPLLIALAVVGTLYGALLATRQTDLRLVIAFSSLSHLNLIGLGVLAGSHEALRGAAVASVSHGLVVAALFLLVAMLATRAGSFDFSRLGGLAATAPVLTALTTFVVAAAIAVPGTSGFAGEFLILVGAFAEFPLAGAIATTVVVVSAVYGLRLLQLTFFGPATLAIPDLRRSERLLLVPLLVLTLLLGIAPRAITDRVPLPDATPAATQ